MRAGHIFPIPFVLVAVMALAGHDQGVRAQEPHARTGNPLIDSILEAPGPRQFDDRRNPRGFPRDQWRDDARRDDERDAFSEDGRRNRPASRPRDADRRTPYLGAPEQRARSFVPAPPPPLPAARGELPTSLAAAPPAPPVADRLQTPLALAPEPDQDAATVDAAPPIEDSAPEPRTMPRALTRTSPDEQQEPQPAPLTALAEPPRPSSAPARAQTPAEQGPSLEHMIGQMLIIGFQGQAPRDPGVRIVAEQLRAGKIGGVIFMSQNIASPQQVMGLTSLFAKAGEAWPTVLISVDQEGGYVQRLERTKGFETHPSAGRIGIQNDPEAAYAAYRRLAMELRAHGFNLNFGPVLDLELNPQNPIIARLRRSYGSDPNHVGSFARAFIFAHHDSGVLTAVKHFPGHGSSTEDSHTVLPDLTESWSDAELAPYSALIRSDQVDMVMTGHLYHPRFSDRPGLPASLSTKAITDVLRERMGYRGVVITDDLEMAGVRKSGNFAENVVRAVLAGNDILLITNAAPYRADLPDQVAALILRAVENGTLSRERLVQSYERIMALKARLKTLGSETSTSGAPGPQTALPGG
jgi:beta-N-acetylhexosaminidase